MIAYVRGTVSSLQPDGAVLDVGGVGLSLQCTPHTLAALRLGTQTTLAASLVVREDSLTLFGFQDEDERVLFELLQTASGVGPRLAHAMLAVHRPDVLRRAVASEDVRTLERVPGIGRKGAQRIVLELKDRIGLPSTATSAAVPGAAPAWQQQVSQALLGLGWTVRDAEAATAAVEDLALEGAGVPALLRAALRSLDRSA